MKQLRTSLWAKVVAVILLTLFLCVAALSVADEILLTGYGTHLDGGRQLVSSALSNVSLGAMEDCADLSEYYGSDTWQDMLLQYQRKYAPESSNVWICMTVDGQTVFQNRTDTDYRVDTEQIREYQYYEDDEQPVEKTFLSSEEFQTFMDEQKDRILRHTVLSWGGGIRVKFWMKGQTVHPVVLKTAVMQKLNADDAAARAAQFAQFLLSLQAWTIPIAIASGLGALAMLTFLLWAAGHKKGVDGICLCGIDRIPFDLFPVFLVAAFWFALRAFASLDLRLSEYTMLELYAFAAVVGILLVLTVVLSFTRRVKAGKWWRNTVVYRLLRLLWRLLKGLGRVMQAAYRNLPLYWKMLLICAGLTVVELLFLVYDTFPVLWVAEKLLLTPLLVLLIINFHRLSDCARQIAAGDMQARVDCKHMLPEMKKNAEYLNNIGVGMQRAVEVQMRSERMKAELITNVSHDIKTPLTSIINYVDLLKREGLSSANAPEYLAVLERQSARLKKLTTDLVDASKASTGNISVHLERTDAHVLLSQAVGEYEEKFHANALTPVLGLHAAQPFISADGRLLWRVLDNLLGNACKYAQPNTRVYLQTEEADGKLEILCKNISREALNIPPAELMERFVRGDASRSTEGSGLGLSIARSLTELQGGQFDITIDGDLFKVSLLLPLCQ